MVSNKTLIIIGIFLILLSGIFINPGSYSAESPGGQTPTESDVSDSFLNIPNLIFITGLITAFTGLVRAATGLIRELIDLIRELSCVFSSLIKLLQSMLKSK